MKNINDMTKKEILEIVKNKKAEMPLIFKVLIIIPTEEIHDSDFRCMKFVAVSEEGEPLILLEYHFDVIHINGIGGLGHTSMKKPIILQPNLQRTITALGWQIDCLKKSRLLRLFLIDGNLMVPYVAVSSFEIYAENEEPEIDKFEENIGVLEIVERGKQLLGGMDDRSTTK